MRLVVGLGNPDAEYANTRHNVGFLVVDKLQKMKPPKGVVVKKSDRFMNDSGGFVKKLVDKYKLDLDSLYVIHDDLDIPLGLFKIQLGRGPKDHNGIKSIDEALGTNQYWHVRIGIDNRPGDNRAVGEEYVLQNFTTEELKKLRTVTKEVCKKLATLLQNTN